jgi:superfamily I DNA/RNA helicase
VSRFEPTDEQQAIIDAFSNDQEIRVQAAAGSGKTSTLLMLAQSKIEDDCLYVAYNRAIKEEMQQKASLNLTPVTSHSLAFREVGVRYKHRLNGARLNSTQTASLLGVRPFRVSEERPLLNPFVITGLVNETTRQFTYSSSTRISAVHVPKVTGYTEEDNRVLAEHIVPLALRAWKDLQSIDGKLYYSHDTYLKSWSMTDPKLSGDVLMLDEAQDANPCLTGVIRNQTHMQRIMVGDSSQQLYSFRGAQDALKVLPGIELPLSQSFRFGQPIAEEANLWLDELHAPLRVRGFDQVHSEVTRDLPGAKAVLCRTNMGCMGEGMTYLNAGQRVAMVGGTDQVDKLAKACLDLQENGKTTHPELIAFDSWDAVVEYSEEAQGSDLKPMVGLIQRYGAKGVLYATRRFVDESSADVIVSTAHKAKGREWTGVRIGEDFHQEPDDNGEIVISRADAMLAYVSVTRAREELGVGGLDWIRYGDVKVTE